MCWFRGGELLSSVRYLRVVANLRADVFVEILRRTLSDRLRMTSLLRDEKSLQLQALQILAKIFA